MNNKLESYITQNNKDIKSKEVKVHYKEDLPLLFQTNVAASLGSR